ncbi:hypothetical protein DXG03_009028 [Asterophora parasitica]|uniref:Uncharacterized protein n=1 Tax=Asterophora parasitica TaxID=117018 RepID=A0A9P7K8Y3_9AGAR|nr:hypothetical protein DXG03_009028 [Asterophora parasitica]
MLRLHPDKRAKAADLIHHRWLDGVVVQGEIDVIRRAEIEEIERRAGGGASRATPATAIPAPPQVLRVESQRSVEKQREKEEEKQRERDRSRTITAEAPALTQSEKDAMKPVERIAEDQEATLILGDPAAKQGQVPRLGTAPVPPSAKEKENQRRS